MQRRCSNAFKKLQTAKRRSGRVSVRWTQNYYGLRMRSAWKKHHLVL